MLPTAPPPRHNTPYHTQASTSPSTTFLSHQDFNRSNIPLIPDRVSSVRFAIPPSQKPAKITPPQSVVHEESWDGFSQGFPEDDGDEHSADILRAHQVLNRSADPPQRAPTMSDTDTAPSVFDHNLDFGNEDTEPEQYTEPTQDTSLEYTGDDGPNSYDLKAPPPSTPLSNIERLSERLFSIDHLKLILQDSTLSARFNSFLTKYRPRSAQSLERYFEVQKALSAIDYANAIAQKIGAGPSAAVLTDMFRGQSNAAYEDLVNDALPGYVTHRFVQVVTETLVKEITGQNTPIMRELVPSLAEVYCLTDPALPDNPIVYASEEFYRTSQYGREYVIGRNCRFLQGPRSSSASVARLIDALAEGQEICETILNYRRDGSPFMNLLMIAPLYDNKGTVRYFIGAQIDINGLITGGQGLDSFERLLEADRQTARYGDNPPPKTPSAALAELASVLNDSEMKTVKESRSWRGGGAGTPAPPQKQAPKESSKRMYFGMDDPGDANLWPAPSLGPNGRLPGVFQNYLLVRPYPSLRITFTSPALRIPGLLQSRFMDRLGGSPQIRDGIYNALASGISVTAKITWLPQSAQERQQDKDKDGRASLNGSVSSMSTILGGGGGAGGRPASSQSAAQAGGPTLPHRSGAVSPLPNLQQSRSGGLPVQAPPPPQYATDGKPRWIHCTPLLGSDSKVGVWMVVMVESETITGHINVGRNQNQQQSQNQNQNQTQFYQSSQSSNTNANAQGNSSARNTPTPNPTIPARSRNDRDRSDRDEGVTSPKYSSPGGPGRLYAEYLRREGRENSMIHPAERNDPGRYEAMIGPQAAPGQSQLHPQVQPGPWVPRVGNGGGSRVGVGAGVVGEKQARGRTETRGRGGEGVGDF